MTPVTHARVIGLILTLIVALAWSAPVQAAPTSTSQDPAQLSTAAVLFVKVDPASGTDTIVVINRQQAGSSTTTGGAINIHLRFYSAGCALKFDNNVSVTPQGLAVALGSSEFGISKPGVILADVQEDVVGPLKNAQFALSGVVIDGNFQAVYERQGSPLLQPNPRGTGVVPSPVWGGFSNQSIDDWFIGGFTMIQMLCPGDSNDADLQVLADDMNNLEEFPDPGVNTTEQIFADGFPVVFVYDAKEVLKRSIHDVPCFCNSDSAFFGDFVDIIASMKSVGLGTFHWESPDGALIAWRVISSGSAPLVYWDARLRTTPGSNPASDGTSE